MDRDSPWKVSRLSHRLGTQVLGSYVEEKIPLAAWRITETGRKA